MLVKHVKGYSAADPIGRVVNRGREQPVDVCVTIDHRFARTPDGAMWTRTSFTYPFWTRYLAAFDRVRVIARVQEVSSPAAHWTRGDGKGVVFSAVPYYHGPWEYLQQMWEVRRSVVDAIGADDAVILRVQGQISSSLRPWLRRTGRPYGVEVVGDPYDAFAPGYITHPLRPFLRWWLPRRMREQITGACAAAYVSEEALQQRYPPAPHAFSTYYSSIVLPDVALVSTARSPNTDQRVLGLVIVGTLDNLSKGPDTLMDAVATCVSKGLDLRLSVVGGGKYRLHLEKQARALGLEGRVRFLGWVPAGDGVRAELDRADLFVLPSRQEGVSRATIEAMGRALPCIATTVGGTSELLAPEDMVPPNDTDALAQKIREVIGDPERMARMSTRNLEKAKEYTQSALGKRWTAFYEYVRDTTKRWMEAKAR